MSYGFLTAYIDPGTGSMLFTIVIGIAATAVFMLQSLKMKLKFSFRGRTEEESAVPYVLFSEGGRYWNIFAPVCAELERRGISCEYWTMSEEDPAFSAGFTHVKPVYIGTGNRAYARLNLMAADVCLATTPGLDVYQWKRSPKVKKYVHIFHAIDDGISYRMFGLDYYDAVLTTGEFCHTYLREMEQLRGLPEKELVCVGSTYMDELKRRRETLPPAADHRTTVLLAPTWGPSGILRRYGDRIIEALRATDCDVIIRPHPQSKVSEAELLETLQQRFPESEGLHWDFDHDNFPSLAAADLLISDFSGVVFDFTLLFDRPLLYADTSFDPSPYDMAWSELPFWKFETLARLGRPLKEEDFPRMEQLIRELIASPGLQAERDAVKAECWKHIGEAAARTADYLTGKEAC